MPRISLSLAGGEIASKLLMNASWSQPRGFVILSPIARDASTICTNSIERWDLIALTTDTHVLSCAEVYASPSLSFSSAMMNIFSVENGVISCANANVDEPAEIIVASPVRPMRTFAPEV